MLNVKLVKFWIYTKKKKEISKGQLNDYSCLLLVKNLLLATEKYYFISLA